MRCGWKAKEPLGGQGRGMDGVEIIGRSSNVIKSRGRPRAWARSRTGSTAEAEVEREPPRAEAVASAGRPEKPTSALGSVSYTTSNTPIGEAVWGWP